MLQIKDLIAVILIGDGVSAAVLPRARVRRWAVGPARMRRLASALDDRPGLTRVLGVAAAALGLWWAARLPPSHR